MPSRDGLPWLIDEYLVVGDLWQRKGRAVGIRDKEVQALARLIGRSPASISRRVGNFAGTDLQVGGLKPITGDALRAWESIRDDRAAVIEAARHARARIALLTGFEPSESSDESAGNARIVAPEKPSSETVTFTSESKELKATQVEAALRERFRSWLDPRENRLQGIEIPTPNSMLRVDLYDPATALLIEAKASAQRNHLRLAVGQLYDYRRYLKFKVQLAVLVPSRPTDDMMGLLRAAEVGAIWPTETAFVDSANGKLLAPPDAFWRAMPTAVELSSMPSHHDSTS